MEEGVVNADDLSIGMERLVDAEGARLEATHHFDPESERLTLTLERPIAPGEHTVHLAFRGTLNDKLKGFYRSTFTMPSNDAPDGVERVIGTTQMEPTDARLAFPCWDEPDFKAVFAVTLVVDDGLLAVSNGGEIARTALPDGRVELQFADTIPMSTYLVAFVVGPLVAHEPVDVD